MNQRSTKSTASAAPRRSRPSGPGVLLDSSDFTTSDDDSAAEYAGFEVRRSGSQSQSHSPSKYSKSKTSRGRSRQGSSLPRSRRSADSLSLHDGSRRQTEQRGADWDSDTEADDLDEDFDDDFASRRRRRGKEKTGAGACACLRVLPPWAWLLLGLVVFLGAMTLYDYRQRQRLLLATEEGQDGGRGKPGERKGKTGGQRQKRKTDAGKGKGKGKGGKKTGKDAKDDQPKDAKDDQPQEGTGDGKPGLTDTSAPTGEHQTNTTADNDVPQATTSAPPAVSVTSPVATSTAAAAETAQRSADAAHAAQEAAAAAVEVARQAQERADAAKDQDAAAGRPFQSPLQLLHKDLQAAHTTAKQTASPAPTTPASPQSPEEALTHIEKCLAVLNPVVALLTQGSQADVRASRAEKLRLVQERRRAAEAQMPHSGDASSQSANSELVHRLRQEEAALKAGGGEDDDGDAPAPISESALFRAHLVAAIDRARHLPPAPWVHLHWWDVVWDRVRYAGLRWVFNQYASLWQWDSVEKLGDNWVARTLYGASGIRGPADAKAPAHTPASASATAQLSEVDFWSSETLGSDSDGEDAEDSEGASDPEKQPRRERREEKHFRLYLQELEQIAHSRDGLPLGERRTATRDLQLNYAAREGDVTKAKASKGAQLELPNSPQQGRAEARERLARMQRSTSNAVAAAHVTATGFFLGFLGKSGVAAGCTTKVVGCLAAACPKAFAAAAGGAAGAGVSAGAVACVPLVVFLLLWPESWRQRFFSFCASLRDRVAAPLVWLGRALGVTASGDGDGDGASGDPAGKGRKGATAPTSQLPGASLWHGGSAALLSADELAQLRKAAAEVDREMGTAASDAVPARKGGPTTEEALLHRKREEHRRRCYWKLGRRCEARCGNIAKISVGGVRVDGWLVGKSEVDALGGVTRRCWDCVLWKELAGSEGCRAIEREEGQCLKTLQGERCLGALRKAAAAYRERIQAADRAFTAAVLAENEWLKAGSVGEKPPSPQEVRGKALVADDDGKQNLRSLHERLLLPAYQTAAHAVAALCDQRLHRALRAYWRFVEAEGRDLRKDLDKDWLLRWVAPVVGWVSGLISEEFGHNPPIFHFWLGTLLRWDTRRAFVRVLEAWGGRQRKGKDSGGGAKGPLDGWPVFLEAKRASFVAAARAEGLGGRRGTKKTKNKK